MNVAELHFVDLLWKESSHVILILYNKPFDWLPMKWALVYVRDRGIRWREWILYSAAEFDTI